jgi:hypothetical protein
MLGNYSKTVTAVVTGLVAWVMLVAKSASGPITASEWIILATAVATALGVYGVPGDLFGKWSKTIAAIVSAIIGWFVLVVASPSAAITSTEWATLLMGLTTAFGVYSVSNAPKSTLPNAA